MSLNAKIYFHFISHHCTLCTRRFISFPWPHFYLQIVNERFELCELKYMNGFTKQCFKE